MSTGMSPDRVEAYAKAFLEVAKGEELLDRVINELFHFARAMERSDQLRNTLTDENIPPERRQAIVEELVGVKASPLTASLVSFVVGVGRARDLVRIIDKLVERAAATENREVAEVRSAVPLDEDQRSRMREALESALGKQVEIRVVVDPSVLGGVVAKVGDTIIDGSVRHRLDQLRETL